MKRHLDTCERSAPDDPCSCRGRRATTASTPTSPDDKPWADMTKAEKVAEFAEAVAFITDPEWLPWFEHHHPETMATLREIARRVVDHDRPTDVADDPDMTDLPAPGEDPVKPRPGQRIVGGEDETAAIALLHARGYQVVRAKTYENLHRKIRNAQWQVQMAQQDAESARHWARTSLDESRRMGDRLNEVCFAAAALGVPIGDINAALDKARTATT